MNPRLSIFVLVTLAISAVASMPIACPNVDDLNPCSCKRVAYGLQLVCANFNSSKALQRVFRILRDYTVHNILLHGINLETVPADLFKGVKVKELRVEKSKLKFNQPAFTGLDTSLNKLDVAEKTLINCEDGFALARLTKLSELNIQSNQLGKVEDKWLSGKVPNLHTLVLDDNNIDFVGSKAFSDMTALKQISLAENQIESVERSMFPQPAVKLQRIDLSHNSLRELPDDMFSAMPILRVVILSGNRLQTLKEHTWFNVWEQLHEVYLYENRLVCDDKLEWIQRLRKPYKLEGTCYSPMKLKGKPIKHLYDT